MPKPEKQVLVCVNTRPPQVPKPSCGARGGAEILAAFKEAVETNGLSGRVRVTQTGCLGPCGAGPNVVVQPDHVWYAEVSPGDVPEIVESHLLGGKPVERLLLPEEAWG